MKIRLFVINIKIIIIYLQNNKNRNLTVPSILQKGIKKTQSSITELLEQLMQNVYKFTAAVENVLPAYFSDEDLYRCDNKKLPDFVSKENVQWAIEMLTAFRQQEIYVRFEISLVFN